MKKYLLMIVVAVLSLNAGAQSNAGRPLSLSVNKHYLVSDNKPFFWLGDTGWLLISKLKREDAEKYFQDRADKGFNVIQVMLLHTLSATNAYGNPALVNQNVAKPVLASAGNKSSPGYWEYLDELVDLANQKGLFMALVPVWGSNVKGGGVSSVQAEKYAEFLAKRYRDKRNIIWLNGGDVKGSDSIQVWKTIGATIRKLDPNHLISYHPFGRTQSSQWFHNEAWLDFNMFQSGHRRYDQDTARTEKRYGEDNWRYMTNDYNKKPIKPSLDGEPSYEGIPQGLHDTLQPKWTDSDIRRYAYWSVFSGACGFTYGNNSVMQFYTKSAQAGAYGARMPWTEAINSPGAKQLKYLKSLMDKYRFQDLIPDPSVIAVQGEKYNYQPVLLGKKWLLVYCYNSKNIKLKPEVLKRKSFKMSWYSPRNGELISKGIIKLTSSEGFVPPGTAENGNDWVLILETN
jgi:hypothetical protein